MNIFRNDYDIEWTEQSHDASGSMPIGGGDIGCNVWVENDSIYLYMAQSGWFDENNSLLKAGRIRIDMEPCPFKTKFVQRLITGSGEITILGDRFSAAIWIDREWRVIYVELDSEEEISVRVSYETWRYQDRIVEPTSYELFQCTEMFFYPLKEIRFHKDHFITQENRMIFYHQNDNTDLSAEKEFNDQGIGHLYNQAYNPQKNSIFGGAIRLDDFEKEKTEKRIYQDTPCRAYLYRTAKPVRQTKIAVALYQCYEPDKNEWIKQITERLECSYSEKAVQREKTRRWWRDYSEKSWILLPDRNSKLPGTKNSHTDTFWKVGRNYQLFRFMMGCAYESFWPVKFNGGLFTFDPGLVGKSEWTDERLEFTPDYRLWGGGSHTIQNQRLLYWPLLKSGDFEMILQHFEFFIRTLQTAKERVKHHFGIDGAIYAEQVGTYGLCCGCNQEWGNKSGLPCVQIRYHFSNSLETALMILEYHEFTGNSIGRYLDFINLVLHFYDGFYPENDENGKMILYPANALETYHVVKNPVDGIAGLQCVLERLRKLDEPEVTDDMRLFWDQLYKRIPQIPLTEKEGRKIIAYAETLSWRHNCELPELYTVFPYNCFGIVKDDKAGLELARNTAYLAPQSEEQLDFVSWHPTGIQYARLGMVKEAVDFLKKKMTDGPFRFPAFWGPGHDWVPDHNWGGSGMMQMQEMLMQTDGDNIFILPCWPAEQDVKFRLFAPKNTVVECWYEAGRITKLEICPEERRKDLRIMIHETRDEMAGENE